MHLSETVNHISYWLSFKNIISILFSKGLIFLEYHSVNMFSRWFLGWSVYLYSFSDCKENKGIYTSLHLEYLFNINELLNISMVSKETEWVHGSEECWLLKHHIACLSFMGFQFLYTKHPTGRQELPKLIWKK